ncbi:MAG TPA: hypothetical protein ENJ82_02145 [Bacteroidetes bacterium]|nr:hypothetical protein [Bacteroidota bacterium]
MKAYKIEFTCTCENQILLNPGCACETCMGVIPELHVQTSSESQYPADYFEALEQMQVEIGFAA